MMKLLLALVILFLIGWLYFSRATPERIWTSGSGPGFIPAFQGQPSVGVSGV